MKKITRLTFALLLLSLAFTQCKKEEEKKDDNTTNNGGGGGDQLPPNFLRFGTSDPLVLTNLSCRNDSLQDFALTIRYTLLNGEAANGTGLQCYFFYNPQFNNQTEASPGSYVTVARRQDLTSGRCFIDGFDVVSGKEFIVKGGVTVSLKKVDGIFVAEFNNANADFKLPTEFEPDETRQISGRTRCN
jgi:hypothetical protein